MTPLVETVVKTDKFDFAIDCQSLTALFSKKLKDEPFLKMLQKLSWKWSPFKVWHFSRISTKLKFFFNFSLGERGSLMSDTMSSNNNMFAPKLLLGSTIAFTYALLIMGNLVTTTGSGLDCPDWPLCHGSFNPPKQVGIWIEWTHRLMGGIAGILIAGSIIYMFKKVSGAVKFLFKMILGLLVTVIILGGVVVLIEAPLLDNLVRIATVSSHIIIATIIFTSLILAFRMTFKSGERTEKVYTLWLFGLVSFQVLLGILVRYSNSSLACPDWPLCHGAIFPPSMMPEVLLHYTHRLFAYTVFGLTLWKLVSTVRSGGENKLIHSITFGLVLMQASIGVFIVLTKMFLPFLIAHGAGAFLILGWVAFQAAPYLVLPGETAESPAG